MYKTQSQNNKNEESKQKDLDLIAARKEAINKNKKSLNNNGFEWLNENSRKFLAAGYLSPGVSAEERIREIADHAESILKIDGYADKFYKYMSEGFYSLASPVWSNFGKKRGLPISCFGSQIDDDIGNILYSQSEVGMMLSLIHI